MKAITLATVLIVLNACSKPSEDGEHWERPSQGSTAWGERAPRANHVSTQICVEVEGCISCVYAHVDSHYADSKRPDGARALAEIARQVTHDIDRKAVDACSRFNRAVERKAANDTDFQLNCEYMNSDGTWVSHCERSARGDSARARAPTAE